MFTKEDRWSNILESYYNEEYEDSLYESKIFFEELKINPDDFYIWKAKFQMVLCLKKIGKIKQAMNCAKSSLQYAISVSEKTKVFWILGSCYENINKQQSLKYYKKAIINSKYLKLDGYVYTLEFNVAKLNHDFNKMNKAVSLLEGISKNNEINLSLLNDTYKELFSMYIANNRYRDAMLIIRKVTNKLIKTYMVTTIQQSKVVSICN